MEKSKIVSNEQEQIEVLDEYGNKTGRIVARKEAEQKGYFVGAVTCFIINSKNQILIEQRADDGKLDFCSGHKRPNEESKVAMARELEEELGIKKEQYQEHLIFIDYIPIMIGSKKYYVDVYCLKQDIPMEALTLQESEVQNAYYLDEEEIEHLAKNNRFRFSQNITTRNLVQCLKRTLMNTIVKETVQKDRIEGEER